MGATSRLTRLAASGFDICLVGFPGWGRRVQEIPERVPVLPHGRAQARSGLKRRTTGWGVGQESEVLATALPRPRNGCSVRAEARASVGGRTHLCFPTGHAVTIRRTSAGEPASLPRQREGWRGRDRS